MYVMQIIFFYLHSQGEALIFFVPMLGEWCDCVWTEPQ